MAIRLSGINSGLDTDAIVQELVKAYSLKTEKYEKASTKLTWKQDAWKGLNTKIYGLYTNVSNLRFSSAYNLRKVTVSDNTKATVTASSSSVTGTQKLNILQTAQASYLTGGQLGKDVTAETTMKDLGYASEDATTIKIQTKSGESKKINITKDMKLSEVVAKFTEAGYNASFDTNNKRIFVSAKETGADADFNLMADDENGFAALSMLGLNSALLEKKDGQIVFTEAAGNYGEYYSYYEAAKAEGKSTYEYLTNLYDEYKAVVDKNAELKEEQSKLENQNRAYDATYKLTEERYEARRAYDYINNAITAQESTWGVDFSSTDIKNFIEAVDGLTLYGEDGNVSQGAIDAVRSYYQGTHGSELDESVAKDVVDILHANLENVVKCNNYITKRENAESPDSDLLYYSASELKQQLDTNREKYTENETRLAEIATEIATNDTYLEAHKSMESIEADAENVDQAYAELGKIAQKAEHAAEVYAAGIADVDSSYFSGNAVKIAGSDAVIKLNGVEYTNSTNSFSINGLTINAQVVTGAEDKDAITITTNVDTQGIYDKIKDFLTEYNNVINEMCKLYNAESASDYEPLTDEEKEAMSEEQIEKWETKIKDSLLRRDTTLNSVMSAMINSMAQTIEINGEKLSLSTFGIGTLGFLNSAENENYAYHINGDEDDENTSGKEDELMVAIESNPDRVVEFMKKLTENLYTAIDNKMKSTELSSAYKVYNDKEMDKELSNYASIISKWEEKVSDKEDYYYNKFTQMEKALAKLNSQTSSISGLLGM